MSHFGWIVHKVIEKSDIILEIIDARFIEETRNKEVEYKVKNRGKILIYVINKSDLLRQHELLPIKEKFENCVFVSAKNHLGTNMLRQKILLLARKKGIKQPKVGVIGYPNVGKSSLINAFKGSHSARTSAEAGYTKALQLLRISKDVVMFDTPGVMEKEKRDEGDLAIIGAKNPSSMHDPDLAVFKLIKKYPGALEKYYGIEKGSTRQKIIEQVAVKLNMKKKGNIPDIERASRKILIDWQSGNIKYKREISPFD